MRNREAPQDWQLFLRPQHETVGLGRVSPPGLWFFIALFLFLLRISSYLLQQLATPYVDRSGAGWNLCVEKSWPNTDWMTIIYYTKIFYGLFGFHRTEWIRRDLFLYKLNFPSISSDLSVWGLTEQGITVFAAHVTRSLYVACSMAQTWRSTIRSSEPPHRQRY